MSYDIRNKLVLITGASSGIGKAAAFEFASKGAQVALVARNKVELNKVQRVIQEKGDAVEAFVFDLTDISRIGILVRNIRKHFETSVDILVNNAGMEVSGKLEEVPLDSVTRVLQVNCLAPLELARQVLPEMKRKQSGQIINITSGAGTRGLPGNSANSASKFALNGWTESLRVEVRQYGIDVISFSPGPTKTNIDESNEHYGDREGNFINEKKATPDEIAQKVVQASIKRKLRVDLSKKGKLGKHLNYWIPNLFDKILAHIYHK